MNNMEWISVKDCLPYPYDYVLVFVNHKGTNEPRPIAIARMNNMKYWEILDDTEVGAYQDMEYEIARENITHWMPLPKMPEKEN